MTDVGDVKGSALGADVGAGEYNYKFITREQITRINPVVDLKSNKFQIQLPLLQNIIQVELIFSQSVQLDAIYQVSVLVEMLTGCANVWVNSFVRADPGCW